MAGGRFGGGICQLLDLIEEHRDALAYDWRTRFHLSLDATPEIMDWREAVGHARILRRDPSSQLVASLEGWDYPLERGGWMLADLIDIQGGKALGKKWKRYPRPTKPESAGQRWGNLIDPATGEIRSRAQVVAILNRAGHNLPV